MHPDFKDLNNALTLVSKKAEEINEACEKEENRQKITEISRAINYVSLTG